MSINYFARHIGLPRGENLYQIKRGNNGISRDLAERIVAKFPEISKLWLLTGEGQMFSTPILQPATIPFYDTDVEGAIGCVEALQPTSELVIAPLTGCDVAMRYLGKAMGERTPSGTILLLQRTEVEALIPGEEYVVVCKKIVTLRMARWGEEPHRVRLVAYDSAHYDDILLDKSEIEALYKVRGKIIINQ